MHLLDECSGTVSVLGTCAARLPSMPAPGCGRTAYILGAAPTAELAMVCVEAVARVRRLACYRAKLAGATDSDATSESSVT